MKIDLPSGFTPREYQEPIWNAVMPEDFQRGMLVWPRRNGKDLTCWNLTICKALQRVGLYFYIAPFYNQARQIIWEGADGAGRQFLDYVPNEIRSGKPTKIDMRIRLINGSQIKLLGSDNIDAIVGTNPIGIVFTEFSLHKRGVWSYLRPVLAENGGWALFNGTPRGMGNEFYEVYLHALRDKSNWFLQHISRDDTQVPSLEAIQEDKNSGMPQALVNQEYYTSFLSGNVGSYYGVEMDFLYAEGRITAVPYDPRLPLYTFWDLGKRDATAIWFLQPHEQEIRLVDYYQEEEKSLIHHIKMVLEKRYVYTAHYAPHDIKVEEMSTKVSRWDTAAKHGIEFEIVPKLPIQDGIEAVREVLSRCWFDRRKCKDGVNALTHHHKRRDEKNDYYSEVAVKSWAIHGADAFRMLAVMIDEIMELRGWGNAKPQVVRAYGGSRRPIRRSYGASRDVVDGIDYGSIRSQNNRVRRATAHG